MVWARIINGQFLQLTDIVLGPVTPENMFLIGKYYSANAAAPASQ